MTSGYVVTVPRTPLVDLVDTPALVRWNMAYTHARHGWRRPVRQAAKAAFRLVHQRLGIPATGRLRLSGPDSPRTFRADMANTAYSKVLLAERRNGFEPEIAALLRQLTGRLGPVFDVGANCGFFAARLLTTPGFKGHVHAFEVMVDPDPAGVAEAQVGQISDQRAGRLLVRFDLQKAAVAGQQALHSAQHFQLVALDVDLGGQAQPPAPAAPPAAPTARPAIPARVPGWRS
jgi:hypothetical protein